MMISGSPLVKSYLQKFEVTERLTLELGIYIINDYEKNRILNYLIKNKLL
jgi:hypothetical protein